MLNINNFSCGYRNKTIIKDVSLSVVEGDFLGLIGPNGSGKTTMLRAITNIIPAMNGDIKLKGQDVKSLNFRQIAQAIAVVSQASTYDVSMKVYEFVLLGRMPYHNFWQFVETKEDYIKANQAMELTSTKQFKDRLINELSGGERQLVMIAKALAQEPKLILLDEPTSHLDITHQVAILDLLKTLNQELNLSVVVVLHDLNLASEYCDSLVLLKDGRIFNQGKPQDVLTYQAIEEVYKTIVVVKNNPISSKPHIFVVSKKGGDKKQNF